MWEDRGLEAGTGGGVRRQRVEVTISSVYICAADCKKKKKEKKSSIVCGARALADVPPPLQPPALLSRLGHHLEQLASLMGGIASKLAPMKRQIMSGRVLQREGGRAGGGVSTKRRN